MLHAIYPPPGNVSPPGDDEYEEMRYALRRITAAVYTQAFRDLRRERYRPAALAWLEEAETADTLADLLDLPPEVVRRKIARAIDLADAAGRRFSLRQSGVRDGKSLTTGRQGQGHEESPQLRLRKDPSTERGV
jgi:hypothetical protein